MPGCTWSGPINGTRGFACVTCGARADELGETACPMKAEPEADPVEALEPEPKKEKRRGTR